jgi:hypothetical protein
VIARNRVYHPFGSGGEGGNGIAVENGRGNLVAHNLVVGARRAAIRLGIQPPPIGGANNVVRRNLVRGGAPMGSWSLRKTTIAS